MTLGSIVGKYVGALVGGGVGVGADDDVTLGSLVGPVVGLLGVAGTKLGRSSISPFHTSTFAFPVAAVVSIDVTNTVTDSVVPAQLENVTEAP